MRIDRLMKKARHRMFEGLFEGMALVSDFSRRQREIRDLSDITRDLPYDGGADPACTLDVYRPKQSDGKLPVLIYLHGGGFSMCSKETHRAVALAYSHYGKMAVFNVNYRLAPKHRYPAALEDSCRAYRWVTENAARFGADPSQLFVAGESAGGNLTLGLGVCASFERREPYARMVYETGITPKAIMVLCGILQVSETTRFDAQAIEGFSGRWLGVHSKMAQDVSRGYLGRGWENPSPETALADPLLILESEARPERPFPLVFAMVGDRDILLSDTRRLETALSGREAPHEVKYYPGVGHAFHMLKGNSQSKRFWGDNFSFLRRNIVRG